jgi:hypothetical protein
MKEEKEPERKSQRKKRGTGRTGQERKKRNK